MKKIITTIQVSLVLSLLIHVSAAYVVIQPTLNEKPKAETVEITLQEEQSPIPEVTGGIEEEIPVEIPHIPEPQVSKNEEEPADESESEEDTVGKDKFLGFEASGDGSSPCLGDQYVGVGISIETAQNKITKKIDPMSRVNAVQDGGPADMAGIRVGDFVESRITNIKSKPVGSEMTVLVTNSSGKKEKIKLKSRITCYFK